MEIKSFIGASDLEDLYRAIGQFILYRKALRRADPERTLFLAIDVKVFKQMFDDPEGESLRTEEGINLLVFDQGTERSWTYRINTSNNVGAGRDSKGNALKASANEIVNAYKANAVAADDKYKDKTIQITGWVETIGSTRDEAYVNVCDPMIGVTGHCFYCFFDDNHKGELAKLAKGQTIMVRGIFADMQLKKCELLEAKP